MRHACGHALVTPAPTGCCSGPSNVTARVTSSPRHRVTADLARPHAARRTDAPISGPRRARPRRATRSWPTWRTCMRSRCGRTSRPRRRRPRVRRRPLGAPCPRRTAAPPAACSWRAWPRMCRCDNMRGPNHTLPSFAPELEAAARMTRHVHALSHMLGLFSAVAACASFAPVWRTDSSCCRYAARTPPRISTMAMSDVTGRCATMLEHSTSK
jgi:hypothetical protein